MAPELVMNPESRLTERLSCRAPLTVTTAASSPTAQRMIRISEGPTATKRHQARVPNLREDHGWALLLGGLLEADVG